MIRQKLDSSQLRDDADFLSIVELMQERDELAHQPQVIEDNALELFFAGYSTTSSAFCSALLCLGRLGCCNYLVFSLQYFSAGLLISWLVGWLVGWLVA